MCIEWCLITSFSCVISGFCCGVDEIYTFLENYIVSYGNPLPTFQDNVSVPPSRVKKSSWTS
jgi:hypothetical protein